MLFTALLRQPWQSDWQPSEVAAELGYTPMTLSRAVKELTEVGLAVPYTLGRSPLAANGTPPGGDLGTSEARTAHAGPAAVWVTAHGVGAHVPRRLAGLSTLACYSMLTEATCRVYALTAADWKAAKDVGVPS